MASHELAVCAEHGLGYVSKAQLVEFAENTYTSTPVHISKTLITKAWSNLRFGYHEMQEIEAWEEDTQIPYVMHDSEGEALIHLSALEHIIQSDDFQRIRHAGSFVLNIFTDYIRERETFLGVVQEA